MNAVLGPGPLAWFLFLPRTLAVGRLSMKNLDNWSRLARAAADARDELRSLIPALDRAISENHADVRLLERVRDAAIRNAEALLPSSYSTGPLIDGLSADRFPPFAGRGSIWYVTTRIGEGSATSNRHTPFERTEARNRRHDLY
jgi:hypothetical protein